MSGRHGTSMLATRHRSALPGRLHAYKGAQKSMRILLIAALVSSVALAGCGGGEKNSSANNSASANSSAVGAGGAAADDFRKMLISQCERQVQQVPNAPKGFDTAAACRCSIETALGNQADPATFARSPEGQQALSSATMGCLQKELGAAGAKGGTK